MPGDQFGDKVVPRAQKPEERGGKNEAGLDFSDFHTVRDKTEKLQKTLEELEEAQKNLLEQKVGRHEQLAFRLPQLRGLLQAAEAVINSSATLEIMEGLHEANSNIARLKARIEEAKKVKEVCQAQIDLEEEEIKRLFEHPDVSDHIVEEAFKDREIGKQHKERQKGVESLVDANEDLIKEMYELAQEPTSPERAQRQEEFMKKFEKLIVRARELEEKTRFQPQHEHLNFVTLTGGRRHRNVPEAVYMDFVEKLTNLPASGDDKQQFAQKEALMALFNNLTGRMQQLVYQKSYDM